MLRNISNEDVIKENGSIDVDQILSSRSLREYFTSFNTNFYGYKTVEEFYAIGMRSEYN